MSPAKPIWREISEYDYNQALEVLPPAFLSGRGFLIGEPTDHCEDGPRYGAYLEKADRYWHLSEPITCAAMARVMNGTLTFEFDSAELPDVKARALAAHLGVPADTISECRYGNDTYSCESEPGEYWVLTDEEADQAWDEELERYLDECVLCNIEGPLAQYFDCDAWKRDARHDGRGHCLSGYDGEEHEIKVDGEHFYIYRVN